MNKGLFIVIDGMDGAGKSTLIDLLGKHFYDKEYDCYFTCEPGGTIIGDRIRELILFNDNTSQTDFLLFLADRAEHVDQVILPELSKNKIVVSDRYELSTIAYQLACQDMDVERSLAIMRDLQFPVPDLTVVLECDPYIAEKRLQNKESDKHHVKGSEYFKHIKSQYQLWGQSYALMKQTDVLFIDTSVSVERSFDRLLYALNPVINTFLQAKGVI